MDWQPIETAPRDGTRILLYRPLADKANDDQIDIKRGVPRDTTCWEETIPEGMDATNYTDGACKATHWMPLPEPPKVGAGDTAHNGAHADDSTELVAGHPHHWQAEALRAGNVQHERLAEGESSR